MRARRFENSVAVWLTKPESMTMDLDPNGPDVGVIILMLSLMGLITGYIAWRKGDSFFTFFMGGVMFFIIFLPVAIFMKRDQTELDRRRFSKGEIRCRACQEFVSVNATACSYCGRDIKTGASTLSSSEATTLVSELGALAQLHHDGALSDDEFAAAKRRFGLATGSIDQVTSSADQEELSSALLDQSDFPFRRADRDLSTSATTTLKRAKTEGYKVKLTPDYKNVGVSKGGHQLTFKSNREIVRFGKQNAWL
jgi:hypothetical protein